MKTPKPNAFLDRALPLIALGFQIFPLAPNSKEPLKGSHGVLDATDDELIVRNWAEQYRSANVGIACGGGLFVIDVDPRHGGDAGALILPPTMQVYTPHGGRHYYYRVEVDLPPGVNTLGKGIDTRGIGGYVVGPGSEIDGRAYIMEDPDAVIADLPLRLDALLRPDPKERVLVPAGKRKQGTGQKFLAEALERATEGERNIIGFWLACQLRDDGLDFDSAATLMIDYALQVDGGAHSYEAKEALSSLKQAYKREPREQARRVLDPTREASPYGTNGNSSHLEPDEPDQEVDPDSPDNATDEELLEFAPDDNGNALAMRLLYGRKFLFTPAVGWLAWTGTHWRAIPEQLVQRRAIATLLRRRMAAVRASNEAVVKVTAGGRSRVTDCVTLFKTYVVEPDVGIFDADEDLLNCQNGVLNLRTGARLAHDPLQRFTYCVPVIYDPDADSSVWEQLVHDNLNGDKAVIDYFQICVGYCLTGSTREEKLFYLHGPTRSGKGTTTETLLHLLPRPLGIEIDFSTLTAKREGDSQNFDLAELRPARLVIASESNRYQSLNPAKIKHLTGGNITRCAFKHRDMFSYRPRYKVMLVSNHQVNADADDDALWGRVQVFTFPNSHLGSEDVTLKARLRSPAVLKGILRWAVEGAQRWYQSDRLTPPDAIVEATHAHREAQDFIRQWIDDCCVLGPHEWETSALLASSLKDWCEANNIKTPRANDLAGALTKRFGCEAKRATGGVRGFAGIRVQPNG